MGLIGYLQSREIETKEYSFDGLVMAAMRQASTDNLEKLQTAFPELWQDLQARYNAPNGCLDESELKWLEAGGDYMEENITENEEEEI